ncbi:metal-dependent hydrolase [Allocoleopsis sp.]|uniref:metal-dependent hydrolase n=1 Tax=Allocoleopsis sp. TaxID=3088169 RepID=UPI002FD5CC16
MSSFIGHSLAAFSTYSLEKQPASSNRKSWLGWLIIIASAPDIDHIIPALHLTYQYQDVRISHSILLSLVLPFCTILLLTLLGSKGRSLIIRSQQVILAGLSHLVLDLLTGVNRLPLLWPLSNEIFKLPFGILPSAGGVNLFNYFLYRNLLIEIGVLAPLVYIAFLINHDKSNTRQQRFRIGGLLLISICFMIWSFSLRR